MQRESVSTPPLTPIKYAIAQNTNHLVAFGIPIPGGSKLRKSVCKHGLPRACVNPDWVSKHLKGRSAPGFDEAQSIDHKYGRHATGMETTTIARVASNSDSGCIHHDTSWKLTNHCFYKPQLGEN